MKKSILRSLITAGAFCFPAALAMSALSAQAAPSRGAEPPAPAHASVRAAPPSGAHANGMKVAKKKKKLKHKKA